MQKYGQHFLKNKEVLQKIAEALNIKDEDILIEIGPGHGELTEELRRNNLNAKIICVEKDPSLTPLLKEKFKNDSNAEIKEGDALFLVPELLEKFGNKVKLVGNIPYYITGFLFRKLGEGEVKPTLGVFTVQKEVAERMVSKPPEMNRFSATLQAWADPRLLFTIPKEDFEPFPQVDSAVISLKTKDLMPIDLLKYFETARILFQQPRKTIINNLSQAIDKGRALEILSNLQLSPTLRPQDLSVESIMAISDMIKT